MSEKLKGKKVSAISLGCDKNRVDLEKMLFSLREGGFEIVENVSDANIVIVNTCAFITPSKQEALQHIFEMCLLKSKGKLEKVLVSGCLPQRHKGELEKEILEVDAFLSASDNANVCAIIDKLYGVKSLAKKSKNGRIFTSLGSYAFLKIAEGCSNACSYCTIPRIKGGYVSYNMDDLVEEAKDLAKMGVKELILVAQDVSRYGEDLYGKNILIELCQKLCKIKEISWIRLHYLYPEKLSQELMLYMQKQPKMCKYLDVPLQHIDDKILKSMRRRMTEQQTRQLLQDIQTKFPEFALRTTFIVGYPGETRADFKKLCNFVKETKFNYAGFFRYYAEENTPSFYMKNQVSSLTKRRRLKKITKLQHKVVEEQASQMLGKDFCVLLDYFDETEGVFVGHSQFLSPTVDFGVKIVDNGNIKAGDFVECTFNGFDGQNFVATAKQTNQM